MNLLKEKCGLVENDFRLWMLIFRESEDWETQSIKRHLPPLRNTAAYQPAQADLLYGFSRHAFSAI